MKIKVYIVTYKRNDVLNQNLKSLWQCTKNPENIEVTILANHPDVVIDEENKRDNLNLILNTTRMPHAWGYLSRDWNYCILDCFKTWENPQNIDWCVLAQNDVIWVKDWDEWLETNKDYDLITQPVGDQSICMNIEAVKKIGFFDERLTTLHFHEIDYFIRSILFLENRLSINDTHEMHNLSINPVGNVITKTTSLGINADEMLHNSKNWNDSYNYICKKWNISINKINAQYVFDNINRLKKLNFEINWYPFFWDGFKKRDKLFSNITDKKKKSFLYKLLHFYWLRGK
ncbi:MAG: hypothetical protein PHI50_00705 [Alphaproteobacteria bacterium]|nr:hypothetical protein [Alphaproteobacteria bacterium]